MAGLGFQANGSGLGINDSLEGSNFGGLNFGNNGILANNNYSILPTAALGNVGIQANPLTNLGDPSSFVNKQGILGNNGGLGLGGGYKPIELGFNLPTADLALRGAGSILGLMQAWNQNKAIKASVAIAQENLRMSKLKHDTGVEKSAMAAANFSGRGATGMRQAGDDALNRYGSGQLLARGNLAPATA